MYTHKYFLNHGNTRKGLIDFRTKQRLSHSGCQPEKAGMKKFSIATLSLAFLLFAGCKKKEIERLSYSLAGTWELVSVEGGNLAVPYPISQPPYSAKWVFARSTYEYFEDNILRHSGDYKIDRGVNVFTQQETDMIIFNIGNPNPLELPFEISNNVLTIKRGLVIADGTIEKFRRIQ